LARLDSHFLLAVPAVFAQRRRRPARPCAGQKTGGLRSAPGLTGELDVRSFDHGLELHALYLLGQLDPSAVVGKSVVGFLRSRDRADVALVIASGDMDGCADWQGAAWRESRHGLVSLAPQFLRSAVENSAMTRLPKDRPPRLRS